MPDLIYEGIDLANGIDNVGQYFLRDNGESLNLTPMVLGQEIEKSAIDCPFGTTSGFASLLRGEWPGQDPVDGFKSRRTEICLRELTQQYQIVQRWRNRTAEERQVLNGLCMAQMATLHHRQDVSKTAHIFVEIDNLLIDLIRRARETCPCLDKIGNVRG